MAGVELRFVKGDRVEVVNPLSVFHGLGITGTVIGPIDGGPTEPYDYWVRVGNEFADILPFKDEELGLAR